MFDYVKMALRVKTNAFDTEIQGLIDACEADLKLVGIRLLTVDAALLKRAVVLYCKAHFGFDIENGERYMKAYDMLKMSLELGMVAAHGWYLDDC